MTYTSMAMHSEKLGLLSTFHQSTAAAMKIPKSMQVWSVYIYHLYFISYKCQSQLAALHFLTSNFAVAYPGGFSGCPETPPPAMIFLN